MDILNLLKLQPCIIQRKLWRVSSTVRRSAVEVVYKTYGPSPPESTNHMLVLHGLLGFKRNWNSLCNSIAENNNAFVVAMDARNHGDSPHDSSHTYLDLAEDATQLLTKLSINSVNIIGHSMGGRTGMIMALTEPSRVRSLIVVDISPVPRAKSTLSYYFPNLLKAMKAVDFQESDNITKAKSAASKSLLESGVVNDMSGKDFILLNIIKLRDNSFGWRCNLDALINNFKYMASFPTEMADKQYTGPVLFIGGGKSDFVPQSDEAAIKKLFPKASITYLDHVGHNPHSEDPATFLKIVNEFYSINL